MRVLPAARVSLVGLAALVSVFVASPAEAFAPAPVMPVAVPGSVVGSLDGATAAERARMVGNTIPGTKYSVPASAPKAIPKGAGGPVMLGVSAFFLGFDGANAVMRAAGVDNVGLEALFPEHPDPSYTPNADTPPTQYPGWASPPTVSGAKASLTGDQGLVYYSGWTTFNPKPELTYLAPSAQVPTMVDRTKGVSSWTGGDAAKPNYGSVTDKIAIRFYCRTQKTGAIYKSTYVIGSADGSISRGTAQAPTPQTKTYTTGIPSIYTACSHPTLGSSTSFFFDHAEMVTEQFTQGGATEPEVSIALWYPVGSADRPAETDGNPERRWETRYQCSGSAGGVVQSVVFKEGQSAAWPKFPDAHCPSPQTVTHSEVWQIVPLFPEHNVKVIDWTPTPATQDWLNTYPQCVSGACRLELYRVDGGDRLSCFAHPGACVDWARLAEPGRSERFQCEYAGVAVGIAECLVYAPSFNVASGNAVHDVSGVLIPNPEPYADPATGEPQPKPGTPPSPEPDPDNGKCPPPFSMSLGGLGYWVFQGTVCALQAAFVPSPTVLAEAQTGTVTKWSGTAPAVAIGAVGAVVGAFGDWSTTGSCMGPEIVFDLVGQHIVMHPFQACSGVMKTMADFTRWGGTAIVWFAALLSSSRVLAASFGMSLPWDGSEVTGGD